jgi:cytoskeletal protein CcmA (bactofilin family)
VIDTFGRRANSASTHRTIIDADTEIRGTIISRGIMEIRGRVIGDIQHDGTLLVAKGACCVKEITATQLTIEGTVRGHVTVKGKLEIRNGGCLEGTSSCASLVMDAGGVLNGQNHMHHSESTEPSESKAPRPAQEAGGDLTTAEAAPETVRPEAQGTVHAVAAPYSIDQHSLKSESLLEELKESPGFKGKFFPRILGG